ncbi:MAG: hypothetical protein GPJ50_03860 [Candidatus Heimdallarchaeota archaeon]|nr:hypothetical protein [Candidatus Heimdallarchaeota archaeon]
MVVSAYIYINSSIGKLCFECAVKAIFRDLKEFSCDLALEEGDTDDGNDMRSIPKCAICSKSFNSFYIL